MKDIILIGPQGSGKGTQGKILADKFGFKIFETGSVLREIAQEGTDLGSKVREITTRGDLVPNEIVMEIVVDFLKKNNEGAPIIFDGVPRSEVQQATLDILLKEKKRDYIALEISVPEEDVSFERLFKRAELENRADDTEEAIRRRLDNFYTHTAPILEKFKKTNKLVSINGDGTVDEIFDRIIEQAKPIFA